ncbi:hypothetical protein [Micromonospora sp. S4605]|uniref:hypothetical protein n=1 Tax=Micromonospora sp. S4605 TaxID=1420897 RepID=UPI002106C2BE|nr:hypothetical protein [Micromonospora sp. S4605]
MVAGGREHAEALREDVAAVLARIGLRLSGPKTQVVHLDEGFDFLGWHIQRRRQQGSNKRYVYTYPAKKALASIVGKVRTITRRTAHLRSAAQRRYSRRCGVKAQVKALRPGGNREIA